jgi:hypothetical protein
MVDWQNVMVIEACVEEFLHLMADRKQSSHVTGRGHDKTHTRATPLVTQFLNQAPPSTTSALPNCLFNFESVSELHHSLGQTLVFLPSLETPSQTHRSMLY